MAETTYSYTISAIPSGAVAPSRLTQEIQASAIVTALGHISTDLGADRCDVVMKDALSSGDQAILDGVVAAHSGQPLPSTNPVTIEPVPGTSLYIMGRAFSAPADAATLDDYVSIGEHIQGLDVFVTGAQAGDYAELEVLFQGAVVSTFGSKVYVPASGQIRVLAEGAARLVPAGLVFRLRYVAVALGLARDVILHYRFWK